MGEGGPVMFSLKDKIAIVTGGGSGIGLATARRFAAAGAKVVIANRSDSSALAASFGGEYLPADVGEESQVKALVAEVVRRHGRVDILVNSAGVIDDMVPIAEMSGAKRLELRSARYPKRSTAQPWSPVNSIAIRSIVARASGTQVSPRYPRMRKVMIETKPPIMKISPWAKFTMPRMP